MRAGDVQAVQQLLDDPCTDVNARDAEGCTALHWAADGNHVDIAEALVCAGADVGVEDAQGDTAEQYARLCEHQEVLEVLRGGGG